MLVLLEILRFINLFAAAIVAGGQTYVYRVIMPVKKNLETRTSVEVHNAMLGHQTDHYMKPAGIVSGLAAIAIVGLGLAQSPPMPVISVVFLCIGMVGTVGVALLSRYFNVPTNARMLTWSLDNIPEDYPQVRARWDFVHTWRVTCGVTAFTFYLLSMLTDNFLRAGGQTP
jgi:hypothetical protein